MKNLAIFLWKNNFTILFLLLQLISFYLLVSSNNFQRSSFANFTNTLSGNVFMMVSNIDQYLSLKETNDKLLQENIQLKNQTHQSNQTHSTGSYQYNAAYVVNNSTNRRNNYLTLDKGSSDGIERDMAVICNSGVVGVVVSVSPKFSCVMSVLHKDSRISGKLKKDDSFGNLTWNGEDYRYATLSEVANHVKLTKGDTIITSSYGSIYPEGVLIGTIESYEIKNGDPFYTVKVKLSTTFKNLVYVYVIKNKFKLEQDSLELKTQKEK